MANHIFSGVIQQMTEATERTIGVIDADGAVIACSDAEQIGAKWPKLARVVSISEDPVVHFSGKTVKALTNFGNSFDYAVFVSGEDELARTLCVMAHVTLNSTKTYYEEKHDKATFVKNIITDNILPGDIYIRAKELHFLSDSSRVVFLVRQNGASDVAAVDVLQALFPDRQQEFVISVNETDIAVVKLVSADADRDELQAVAQQIGRAHV